MDIELSKFILKLKNNLCYRDCRNNIRFLKNGNIVYHAAAVGIVLDQNNNTQKFFNKHTDDITAFDLHPDDETVATGEVIIYLIKLY